MVKGLVINNKLIPAKETMVETVNSKVSDMVSDIETINSHLDLVKIKSYMYSVLLGLGIGICTFEVVRLIVSFM